MRTALFALATIIFGSDLLWSQPTSTRGWEAPDEVTLNFEEDFPSAEQVSWKSLDKTYEATFHLNGFVMKATYTQLGVWRYTNIIVPEDRMPPAAMAHCRQNYPGAQIVTTGYHDNPESRYYLIDIRRNGQIVRLRYDDDGKFLR
ncbi:MAG: hypothetical protein AAFV07_01365 [Bacteroidota bacterium]